MQKSHRVFIALGLVILAITAFLPLGFIFYIPPKRGELSTFLVKPILGITSWIYYMNLILLIIPFVCGYHGQGIRSKILIILFGTAAIICSCFFCLLIGFSFNGHISGNAGSGLITLILANLAIITGCLFQVSYNKKLDQELESTHE